MLVASPVTAQDTMSALARAERAYRNLETLTTQFTQTIVNPMLGGPEISHGILFLQPPSRFAMKFRDPPDDRIVADGTWLWAYSPSARPAGPPLPTSWPSLSIGHWNTTGRTTSARKR
jgi:outer membrane lipoprotein-sorting protein